MKYDEVVTAWQKKAMRAPFRGDFFVDFVTGLSVCAGIRITKSQVKDLLTNERTSGYTGNVRNLLSIINCKRVAKLVHSRLSSTGSLDISFILELHQYLMFGCVPDSLYESDLERAGQFRKGAEPADELEIFAPPSDIMPRMKALCESINFRDDAVKAAARFAMEFLSIAPFAVGNVRTCSWILNCILVSANMPVISFNEDSMDIMMGAIEEYSQTGNYGRMESAIYNAAVRTYPLWQNMR